MTAALAEFVKDEDSRASLADVAYTLQSGREHFDHRAVAVAAEGDKVVFGKPEKLKGNLRVGFVFPGNGSQHASMAVQLYHECPAFAAAVDEICEIFANPSCLGIDIRTPWLPGGNPEKAVLIQPLLFTIGVALARVVEDCGFTPVACGGHSVGLIAASVVSGLLSLPVACELLAARARACDDCPAGAMLSCPVSRSEAVALAERHGLALAAANAPELHVLSGSAEKISAAAAELPTAKRLFVTRAFHSPLIEEAARQVRGLGSIGSEPRCPVACNVRGDAWIKPEDLLDGSYWSRHLAAGVEWSANAKLLANETDICLELGPGQALTALLKMNGFKNGVKTLPGPKGTGAFADAKQLLGAVGRAWQLGAPLAWDGVQSLFRVGSEPRRTSLPGYAFRKQSYWVNPDASIYVPSRGPPLVRVRERPIIAAARIYCFALAGGSSGFFARWSNQSRLDVVSVELPGRGVRAEEAPSAADAAERMHLAAAIDEDAAGSPVVLVGASMGANVALEVAHALRTKVAAVYIWGRAPPPAAVKDARLCVFCGVQDPSFPIADAGIWFDTLEKPRNLAQVRYFPGDHSFLELEREAMCAGVEQDFLAHLLALKAQEMSVLSTLYGMPAIALPD